MTKDTEAAEAAKPPAKGATPAPRPAMPPEIAKAVVAVMGKVKKLEKSARNDFADYTFTTIDDFMEEVRGKCHEAGLFFLQDEVGMQVRETTSRGKSRSYAEITYSFTLAHACGAVYDHPTYRTVVLDANGPQTFGAAQSYALKQFLRSLFLMATGDGEDLDYARHTPLPNAGRDDDGDEPRGRSRRRRREREGDDRSRERDEEDDRPRESDRGPSVDELVDDLIRDIDRAESSREVDDIVNSEDGREVRRRSKRGYEDVQAAAASRKRDLGDNEEN